MSLFTRRATDVRPLPAGIESLLRGLPAAVPPDHLRTRLMAMHARSESPEPAPLWARFRVGALSGAIAAGMAVGAFALVSAPSRGADPAGAMQERLPSPGGFARARVVNDPLATSGAGDPIAALTPHEGP